MRILQLICLALLLLIGPALAEGVTGASPGNAPFTIPLKPAFTNSEALSLLQALRALDGRQVVVKQGATESIVMQPWDFASGTLRLRIARNITALAVIERTVDETRINILKELIAKKLGNADGITPGSPGYDEFQKQFLAVLNEGAAADLSRIRASELRLDKNDIPVTALSALAPILDDDVSPK